MRITVNGQWLDARAATLAALLDELGYGGAMIATALNQAFVPARDRPGHALRDGDQIEIVAPMQGG